MKSEIILAAASRSVSRIAPAFPLDRLIAVNPLWGHVSMPMQQAVTGVERLTGASVYPGLAAFRRFYREGKLHVEQIQEVARAAGLDVSEVELLVRNLAAENDVRRRSPEAIARWVDLADDDVPAHEGYTLRRATVEGLSQACASFFAVDHSAHEGLFRHARAVLASLSWAPSRLGWERFLEGPATASDALVEAIRALDVSESALDSYLLGLLFDLHGWASACAYRDFVAAQSGRASSLTLELLALRTVCERLVQPSVSKRASTGWARAMSEYTRAFEASSANVRQEVLLTALERTYQDALVSKIARPPETPAESRPETVAVFCIDVRSEAYRRSLETVANDVVTRGFAGFFGIPQAFLRAKDAPIVPHLPGPLAPQIVLQGDAAAEPTWAERALALYKKWRSEPTVGFAFVESMALSVVGELAFALTPQASAPRRGAHLVRHVQADGTPLPPERKVELCRGILTTMGLSDFGALVVFVGHGTQCRNNPQAAALECGACGGQSGELSVRVLSEWLNDPSVRSGLRHAGFSIPGDTWFLPALHNTTQDEVRLLVETNEIPVSHRARAGRLLLQLERASTRCRRERSRALGLSHASDDALRSALEARANDWAEVRPEWGLVDNAAIVFAPRIRTKGRDLEGRVFLHDYDARSDEDGRVLEGLLSAPMVVAHWINLQYYASTVAPDLFGSGNKLLHNVVLDHLGVLEGNGGDLRIGLALQSVHDGVAFRHTPQRLSVLVEATEPTVRAILERTAVVRNLVENGWVHLLLLEPGGSTVVRWEDGMFRRMGDRRDEGRHAA